MSKPPRPGDLLRVGFNARLLVDPRVRGWNRYTVDLLRELPAHGVFPILYTHAALSDAYLRLFPAGGFAVEVAPTMNYLAWLLKWVPGRCRADRLDLFHSPFNFGLPPTTPCPRVLTLHDAIDVAYRPAGSDRPKVEGPGRWSTAGIKSAIDHKLSRARADRIITVSEHAKADIVRWFRADPARVAVTPEAADPVFHAPVGGEARARVRARYDLPPRYIFYVGGWEGRKNVPFLVRAFARANVDGLSLAIAGGGDSQRAELVAQAESLGIGDRLRPIGWVEDEDLAALYAEATGFVYPSVYEGFGLQLCEAMAVGCPTFASRATSLPEVLGDGGETFALDDPAELAGLIRRVADDPEYRARLSDRARRRSLDYSWSRTAAATVRVYRDLLESRSAS